MERTPEKFIISIEKAKKSMEIADHLIYITFPIIKENRLLLKILEELNTAIINTINAILQYEYTYKRIQLYKNAQENFNTFKKIAGRYNINQEQIKIILEILSLTEKHKKSPFEFTRKNKIVIMSENLKTDTLSIEKLKSLLLETKDIIRKARNLIKPLIN